MQIKQAFFAWHLFNLPGTFSTSLPGEDGTLHIEAAAMGRLEILLPPGTGSVLPLPVGASLDENGTLAWQIGVGFLGLHRLIFLVDNPDGTAGKPKIKEIIVNIL